MWGKSFFMAKLCLMLQQQKRCQVDKNYVFKFKLERFHILHDIHLLKIWQFLESCVYLEKKFNFKTPKMIWVFFATKVRGFIKWWNGSNINNNKEIFLLLMCSKISVFERMTTKSLKMILFFFFLHNKSDEFVSSNRKKRKFIWCMQLLITIHNFQWILKTLPFIYCHQKKQRLKHK